MCGVSRFFQKGRVIALLNVDLCIQRSDYIVITGPSGSGKSTLLHLMSGLDSPSAGRVFFEAHEPQTSRAWARIRAWNIGFVFQTFHLLPTLNVAQNIEVPMFGVIAGVKERRQRVQMLAERIGLSNRICHYPAELSGGECQRVAIARSLANRPALILADEPTGNLDTGHSREIMTLLEEVHARERTTLIIVTHDRRFVSSARRCLELVDGQIVSDTQEKKRKA
jgi:ABC-type lipoprotein export system ATPase subunit